MSNEENTQTWQFYKWLMKHPLGFMLLMIFIVLLVAAVGYELAGAWRFPPLKLFYGK